MAIRMSTNQSPCEMAVRMSMNESATENVNEIATERADEPTPGREVCREQVEIQRMTGTAFVCWYEYKVEGKMLCVQKAEFSL